MVLVSLQLYDYHHHNQFQTKSTLQKGNLYPLAFTFHLSLILTSNTPTSRKQTTNLLPIINVFAYSPLIVSIFSTLQRVIKGKSKICFSSARENLQLLIHFRNTVLFINCKIRVQKIFKKVMGKT